MLISIPTRFTEEQKRGLEALSRKTGAPQAELIRRAVAEYLKRQGEQRVKVINDRRRTERPG